MGTRRINLIVAGIFLLSFILQTVLVAQPATQPDPAFDAVYKVWAGGSQRAAERMFPQLIQDNPQNVRLLFFQGLCMRIRSGPSSGKMQLQQVVVMAPESIEGQCAGILIQSDKISGAAGKAEQIRLLQQLADANPDDPLLVWAVSNLAYAAGNYELTLAICQKMSRMMDPGPPQLHHTWANSLHELKRFDEALPHRKLALALEEGAWSHGSLGLTLTRLHRYDQANAEYAKAVAIYPSADHWEEWAYNLYDSHDYEQAIEKCDKATQADPRRWRCWNLCGLSLKDLGRNEEAMAKFDKAMEVAPHEALAFRNAAKVLRTLGRNDEADKITEKWKLAGNTAPLNP